MLCILDLFSQIVSLVNDCNNCSFSLGYLCIFLSSSDGPIKYNFLRNSNDLSKMGLMLFCHLSLYVSNDSISLFRNLMIVSAA